jgi:hypothetical protein
MSDFFNPRNPSEIRGLFSQANLTPRLALTPELQLILAEQEGPSFFRPPLSGLVCGTCHRDVPGASHDLDQCLGEVAGKSRLTAERQVTNNIRNERKDRQL